MKAANRIIIVVSFLFCLVVLWLVYEYQRREYQKEQSALQQEHETIAAEHDNQHRLEKVTRIKFDPLHCKSDAGGVVYWAAGNHVFRFPYRPDVPIYSRAGTRFATKIDVPVDDSEMEGCQANPLHGGAMPYMRKYAIELWELLTEKPFSAKLGSGPTFRAIDRGARNYIEVNSKAFETLYAKNLNCFERAPEFIECLTVDGANVNDPISRHIRFTAGSRDNADSRRLYITGISNINPKEGLAIQAGYGMYGGIIRVKYEFNVQPEELPKLVEFDRAINTLIEKAFVKSY